jgi:hypothetical protein
MNKNTVAIFLRLVKTQNPRISFQNIIFCSLKLVHWFDTLSVFYEVDLIYGIYAISKIAFYASNTVLWNKI